MQLFLVLNLIYFIISSFAWPSIYVPEIAISLFGIAIYLVYYFIKDIHFKLNTTNNFIVLAYFSYFIYSCALGSYNMSIKYLPAVMLCLLNIKIKIRLLDFISKWYGILIGISICIFISSFFITLPSLGTIYHYMYAPFENHIFYLKLRSFSDYIRFNGFFFEAGHCAMVGSMLLFANRYDFKNNPYLIPILISVLLSLSLAGYVLLILGFLFQNIKSIKSVIISLVCLLGIFGVITDLWNYGDNPVNELIFERLEYDEKNGIKGNNRAYLNTDLVLDNAIENNDIWTGVGITRFNDLFNRKIAGSGIKIFILQYGIIGVLLIALMFYSYSLTAIKSNRFFAKMFLLFIALAFLQRCYTFWFSWQLPFICSIVAPKIKNSVKSGSAINQC